MVGFHVAFPFKKTLRRGYLRKHPYVGFAEGGDQCAGRPLCLCLRWRRGAGASKQTENYAFQGQPPPFEVYQNNPIQAIRVVPSHLQVENPILPDPVPESIKAQIRSPGVGQDVRLSKRTPENLFGLLFGLPLNQPERDTLRKRDTHTHSAHGARFAARNAEAGIAAAEAEKAQAKPMHDQARAKAVRQSHGPAHVWFHVGPVFEQSPTTYLCLCI